MLDAVLRVYGEKFDVESFLGQYRTVLTSEVFKKGELDIFGSPNEFSGFDVIVAEQADAKASIAMLHQFLAEQKEALQALMQDGVQCVLDLDVTVSQNGQMPDSVSLPTELLNALVAFNIAVEFSVYPPIESE